MGAGGGGAAACSAEQPFSLRRCAAAAHPCLIDTGTSKTRQEVRRGSCSSLPWAPEEAGEPPWALGAAAGQRPWAPEEAGEALPWAPEEAEQRPWAPGAAGGCCLGRRWRRRRLRRRRGRGLGRRRSRSCRRVAAKETAEEASACVGNRRLVSTSADATGTKVQGAGVRV